MTSPWSSRNVRLGFPSAVTCITMRFPAVRAHQRNTRSTAVSSPYPHAPVAVASVVFADIKPRETIIVIFHTNELDNLTGPVLVER